jgi:hypothetical protein
MVPLWDRILMMGAPVTSPLGSRGALVPPRYGIGVMPPTRVSVRRSP